MNLKNCDPYWYQSQKPIAKSVKMQKMLNFGSVERRSILCLLTLSYKLTNYNKNSGKAQ